MGPKCCDSQYWRLSRRPKFLYNTESTDFSASERLQQRAIQRKPSGHWLFNNRKYYFSIRKLRNVRFPRKSTCSQLMSYRPEVSSPAVPRQFLVTYSVATRNKRRADSDGDSGYVTPDGKGASSCYTSDIYSLSDSYILSAGDDGIFSTSFGVPFQPFKPSTTVQSIYAIWRVENGELGWYNGYFLNGKASFCLEANSSISVYFTTTPPTTCTSIVFSIEPCELSPVFLKAQD